MEIRKVETDKKRYLDLLLLADEQESMIDRYLEQGDLFALYDGGLRTICVVCDKGAGEAEIKNLATEPAYQGKGYGRAMMDYVCSYYRPRCRRMLVGTGDSPLTLPFYRKCGFRECGRVKNFFLQHYDHPIWEGGKLLTDMIYLEKLLD